jgi:hypothetical protein
MSLRFSKAHTDKVLAAYKCPARSAGTRFSRPFPNVASKPIDPKRWTRITFFRRVILPALNGRGV